MGDHFRLHVRKRSVLRIGSKFYVADDEHVALANDNTVKQVGQIAKAAAKMTTGYTGATISGICNEAGIMAVREQIQAGDSPNRLIVASTKAGHIAKAVD